MITMKDDTLFKVLLFDMHPEMSSGIGIATNEYLCNDNSLPNNDTRQIL